MHPSPPPPPPGGTAASERPPEGSPPSSMMAAPVAWAVSRAPVAYEAAVAAMEARAAAIRAGAACELIWLLEHPPLYTAGVSARDADLLEPERFPVYRSGRGGQFTYHGPGQRVVYVMLDLRTRGRDVRAFIASLEAWVIAALARLGVAAATRGGRVGVWVASQEAAGVMAREDKIAAIGVRLKGWVSFHGLAINVAPDLSHFAGIAPCGLREERYGVTSLAALGVQADMARVDAALQAEARFGALTPTAPPA